mmetsp:Transcript_68347/g.182084  ORF Transcript_68347/g.182084 Transcript_68347/m.182084 type:complete len:102 (-) Transcript_68347:68-373(-)
MAGESADGRFWRHVLRMQTLASVVIGRAGRPAGLQALLIGPAQDLCSASPGECKGLERASRGSLSLLNRYKMNELQRCCLQFSKGACGQRCREFCRHVSWG